MVLKKTGLILEGGGMRGAYTSGVLDAFMDEKIKFSYLIGVSAGANNGADFVSEQRERNKKVFVDMIQDKRYMGLLNLFKQGSYFGMDFLFDKLPNELVPFDYDTFNNSSVRFKVGTTDCETGEGVYFDHKDFEPRCFVEKVLRASCSLPIISPAVEINGHSYLDGGLVNPIPIDKSIDDGNIYNVIILTRNKSYRKSPAKLNFLINIFLHKYPKVIEAIQNRHKKYNDCLDKINKLEKEGRVYVFRPKKELTVDRYEKNVSKLKDLYQQGYDETVNQMNDFRIWINKHSIHREEKVVKVK